MGPQPFGCGMFVGPVPTTPTESASMGPQPFGCGMPHSAESRASRRWSFNGAAAFRLRNDRNPCATARFQRSFNGAAAFRLRNDVNPPVASPGLSGLQWGRSLSAAECRCPGIRASSRLPRLQWGRSLSAAECRCSSTCGTCGAAGFNGAAAFRLRNGRRRERGVYAQLGFNGAAAFRLRNVGPTMLAISMMVRFNGAAAFRLRNGFSPRSDSDTTKSLQWGRSLSAAGCAAAGKTGAGRPALQWGRIFFRRGAARSATARGACLRKTDWQSVLPSTVAIRPTVRNVCPIQSPPPARKHRATASRPQRPAAGSGRGLDENR